MKVLIVALIAGLFGLAIGYELASRVLFPKFVADVRLAEHSIDSEQRFGTVVSLAALTNLEAGEVDKTKTFLAHQIASYYRAKFDSSLPQNQRLRPSIEAASEKSSILKEELTKQPK
jgi:hypothetical protein